MAFKKETVLNAITNSTDWASSSYYQNDADFQNNLNEVTDYLTGVSTSLNNTTAHHGSYYFTGILSLIHDDLNSSADDQLVLDVICHQHFLNYLGYQYSRKLMDLFEKKPSVNIIDTLEKHFYNLGLKSHNIIHFIIDNRVYYDAEKLQNDAFHLLNNYIGNTISKYSDKDFTDLYSNSNSQSYSYGRDSWSYQLFKILDAYNKPKALEYIQLGLDGNNYYISNHLKEFSNNEDYANAVRKYINESKNTEAKTGVALQMYFYNKEKFQDLILGVVENYLTKTAEDKSRYGWGNNVSISNIISKDYIRIRTACWYILFTESTEEGYGRFQKLVDDKEFISSELLELAAKLEVPNALKAFDNALASKKESIDYYRDVIEVFPKYFSKEKYLEMVWKFVSHKSKPLRVKIANIIATNDPDAEDKGIALLNDKSADARQTAALILSYFPGEKSFKAISNILDNETNDIARDILLQSVESNLPKTLNQQEVATMVEAAFNRGKLNKPVETWLNEEDLPKLYFQSGEELDLNATRFLLYRMSRIKAMQSDIEAKHIISLIDKEKAAPFALAIIQLYKQKDAKPEHKYLMALSALLGNDSVVDKIRTTINNWVDDNRYKMAEYGVGALALQGSNKALRWVEWYSRKYRSKKANIGAAALAALEVAANELDITIHELGDRIVPDFDFDGLFKHFELDGEEYRAFIDSNFKIAYFNEDNKKLKAIPANADKALKDEFKDIGKEIRDIVKSQSPRMEYYLIIQRRWTIEQWQQFFLNNPVMFIYATKILWGVYDNTGAVKNTFIVNEDTTLLNIDEEEFDLDEYADETDLQIGLVYPTQLPEADNKKWQQLFFDNSIETIFSQLDRTTSDLKDIDLTKGIILKYDGKRMTTGSIKSTLEKFGWHKGPTGDGGMLESYNLLYHEKQIEAVLELEGVGVGYGWSDEEKLGRLYFINKQLAPNKWYGYIKDETDEKLIKLQDLPDIFLSETLSAIEKIKPFEG